MATEAVSGTLNVTMNRSFSLRMDEQEGGVLSRRTPRAKRLNENRMSCNTYTICTPICISLSWRRIAYYRVIPNYGLDDRYCLLPRIFGTSKMEFRNMIYNYERKPLETRELGNITTRLKFQT